MVSTEHLAHLVAELRGAAERLEQAGLPVSAKRLRELMDHVAWEAVDVARKLPLAERYGA